MEHDFKIMHQHRFDDMALFKTILHHYVDFFSRCILGEVPIDYVYVGDLREKFQIDNTETWTYGYDGQHLHYQLAPTFTTSKNFKSKTFIRDSEDRLVSIVTKSYFDGNSYKYAISSFNGPRGRLTGELFVKDKPQSAMIYGEHIFKNKSDLVKFIDEASSEGTKKIILYVDRCGSDNRISLVSGQVEICHHYLPGNIVNYEHGWEEEDQCDVHYNAVKGQDMSGCAAEKV